jgi:hypothetical protein
MTLAAPNSQEQYAAHLPALHLLCNVGWNFLTTAQALTMRGSTREVILRSRLVDVLQSRRYEYKGQAYPLSSSGIEQIVRELSAVSLAEGLLPANERLYGKLALGITVTEFMPDGKKHQPTIPVIDWANPAANQWDVTEEMEVLSAQGTHHRTPDVVCFVNGLPLVVIEAKRPESTHAGKSMVTEGVSQHLRNQRTDEIPQLFGYAQLLLAVSQTEGRYGTTGTAAAQYTINAGASHDYMFRAVVDLVLPAGMVSSTNTVAVDAVGCATAPNDCTETLWAPGSVSGTVFVDGTSQPIEGVSVSLLDSSGAVVATTITAADGTYSFANIAAGDYAIIETQPVGYGQGLVAPSGTLAVTVTAGTAAAGNDFSERLGTISGTVYIDGTNTPIAGVELTLLDGSDAVVATALTDSNGNYVFTDVLGGPFKIVETQPAGYGEGLVTSSDMIAGDLIPGDTSTGNDFSEAAATIAGRVFVDGTSAPLGNVTIELLDSTNTVIATTVTATDGTYMFADLIAGDYQVREIQPSVFGPGVVEADNLIPVTVAAGATSVGNDFSEGTAAITGRVFVDGTLAAISGVTVSLTDSSGTVVATTTTVADGSYSFAGLTLGDYTIVEAQPAGYLNGAVTPGNSIPVTVTAAG